MFFDKNQCVFPSASHREVWWWAVGLVPPSDSLTDEVKSKSTPDVLEGCYQWYNYFNELCVDMYNNISEYAPATARQYRDILEAISANGKTQEDRISWGINDWEAYAAKLNKSKAYTTAGITLNQCVCALERTGLRREYAGDDISFSIEKYPKIFYAMQTMENSPEIRKTPARHHFAHCEFRQLFKSYSANYDELLRRASDESLYIVHSIHDFAKSLRIQRYIHFGIIKYKYKNIRVMDFNLYGDEYPTLRVNIGTCASPDSNVVDDDFYKFLLAEEPDIQEIFINKLVDCDDQSHKHQSITINGREMAVCPCSKIRINPFKDDLKAVLCFMEARKTSIDQK